MNYVCGFLFNPMEKSVALVLKQKPEWQKGKLNGVGGKIESNEDASHAMIREFHEETGVHITRWKLVRCERFITGPDGGFDTRVYFYGAVATSAEWDALRTVETEEIIKWKIDYNDPRLMYNLRYLIPMCEVLMGERPERTPVP